eukprot:2013667-Pyramimonas_sp.AAC.1
MDRGMGITPKRGKRGECRGMGTFSSSEIQGSSVDINSDRSIQNRSLRESASEGAPGQNKGSPPVRP